MRRASFFSIAIFVSAQWLVGAPAQTLAETDYAPWEGELTGMNVYVRSGPGTDNYATTKLNTGDRVLILGEKLGWYRILPTGDSFSYIDKTLIESVPGTKRGTVTRDQASVRAGSRLTSRKAATQLVLTKGDDVEILGQADGFYKITPPWGAALYISKQYVQKVPERLRTGIVERYLASKAAARDPSSVSEATTVAAAADIPPDNLSSTVTANQPRSSTDVRDEKQIAIMDDAVPISVDSTLQDFKAAANAERVAPPQDRQAEPLPPAPILDAEGRFPTLLAAVESDLGALLRKQTDDRHFEPLIKRYQEIASQTEDRISSQFATIRIKQLRNQISLGQIRAQFSTDAADLASFRSQMQEQRMTIMRARAEKTMIKFDLEGELRRSFAFAPERRRFRLVDPQRQTTLAYVDVPPEIGVDVYQLIGRVVGIRTSGQRYSPSAGVPIAMAAHIVDLTPMMPDEGVINPPDSPNRRNTEEESTNNLPEAARQEDGSAEAEEVVAAADDEDKSEP